MKKTEVKYRTTKRLEGIVALAREIGTDRGTIYRVVHGLRRSPRVRSALEARGIKCAKVRIPKGV